METKDCPKCRKKAILIRTGTMLTVMPPQWPRIWWCACGYMEDGPPDREKSAHEVTLGLWQQAQEASA